MKSVVAGYSTRVDGLSACSSEESALRRLVCKLITLDELISERLLVITIRSLIEKVNFLSEHTLEHWWDVVN